MITVLCLCWFFAGVSAGAALVCWAACRVGAKSEGEL